MARLTTFKTAGGTPFTVGSDYADRFKGLADDLEARGYKIDPGQSGGYNYRNIAGTNTLSKHALGQAVDINWTDNPQGGQGNIDPDTARTLAKKWGLQWGGDWSGRTKPDPMHFEVAPGDWSAPTPSQVNVAQNGAISGGMAPLPPPMALGGPKDTTGTPSMPNYSPMVDPYTGTTPEQVDTYRKRGQRLYDEGTSAGPVAGVMGAIAKALTGAAGGYYSGQADQGEAAGRRDANMRLVQALTNKASPEATATSLMGNPYSADTGSKMALSSIEEMQPYATRAKAVEQYAPGLSEPEKTEFKLVGKLPGDEYGKQGAIVQDKNNNFYSVQFGAGGQRKIEKLELDPSGQPVVPGAAPAPGVPPTPSPGPTSAAPGAMPSPIAPAGLNTPAVPNAPASALPVAPGPRIGLSPSKGIVTVDTGTGHRVLDKATGLPVGQDIPKDIKEENRQKQLGEGQGKIAANLPSVEANADRMVRTIDNIVKDPNLGTVTSWAGGRIPRSYQSPSQAKSQANIDQVQGQTFIQAYNDLRGAGQISDAEGSKATAAYNRLGAQTQDTEAYRDAAKEFKKEILRLTDVARVKAGEQPKFFKREDITSYIDKAAKEQASADAQGQNAPAVSAPGPQLPPGFSVEPM